MSSALESGWIPLLSPRPFSEFSPTEYQDYVRSLYTERRVRKSAVPRAAKKDFSFAVNARGALVIKVNREPKWITEAEFASMGAATGIPLNKLWLMVKKRGISFSTQSEEDEIKLALSQFPW